MREASRKTAVALFIVRFFKLLLSVATLSVSARFFGVGLDRESWILSLNFVVVLNLALWGPLNETFRAKFIFIRAEEGEAAAIRKAGSLLLFSLVVLAGIVLILEACSLPLARVIAPAYDAGALEKVSLLLRYLLWSALITQATQLLSSILNTYNSFFVPEICGFVSALINLAVIWIFSPYIGIYSFVAANYISLFILLAALIYQVRKRNIPLFREKPSLYWRDIKPYILFSIPFFLPYIIGQANGLIEKSISNILGNSTVAIIDYAKKIPDIIQTVLTGVLTTIMVPALSSRFTGNKIAEVEEETRKYLQLILLMLAFIIPVLMVGSGPVTDILYNKGGISAKDLSEISNLIRFYALALFAIFLYLVFGLVLLSVSKNKTYAFYGMVAQIIMIVLNFLLYRTLGIYTFVCSLALAHFITAAVLFFHLPFSRSLIGLYLLKYSTLIAATAASAYLANRYLYHPGNAYLNLCYNSIMVVLLSLFFGAILQLHEVRLIKQFVINLRKKS